jgi:hypothetical protein
MAGVRSQSRSCGSCCGKRGTGADFALVFVSPANYHSTNCSTFNNHLIIGATISILRALLNHIRRPSFPLSNCFVLSPSILALLFFKKCFAQAPCLLRTQANINQTLFCIRFWYVVWNIALPHSIRMSDILLIPE